MNTLIPISLIITLEVVKLIQGFFMSSDPNCYSQLRKKWLTPNSVSLNEECGLVDYVFSDKTGTLTCNKMEFKYCVIGDVCYQYMRGKEEENSEKEIKFRNEENIYPFTDYEMYETIYGKDNDNSKIKTGKKNYANYIIKSDDGTVKIPLEQTNYLIEHFWTALSLCHTCSVEANDDGVEEYICVSPDSIELVKAAKSQGWRFEESGKPDLRLVILGEENFEKKINYEKLQILEFTSDRKRETIIVRSPDNKIILYCKGADSIIEQRLSNNTNKEILQQCKYYVDKFSAQGLRTLFIAMKVLSENEYKLFFKDYTEAMMSLEDKDKKVNEVCDKIEKNLFLIGTTIVEDKLQEKVPETIRDLRLAQIKVWMLTGDKMNTAYNIGLSCNLINNEMKIFSICGIEPKKDELTLSVLNHQERAEVIINFAKEFQQFKGEYKSMDIPQYGILVDEKALLTIEEEDEIKNIFLDIAKDAVAVICCRVSPLQIGDGGNDVSMIMEAHIGVGIYGEEGLRAVQNSDYAIGEFRFLHDLLLFHGRTNYMRNAQCILYFFYKNFVFTFLQFVFGFYCNFTGQTIIDDWFITLFNLLFTSLPLGARALLDHDVKPEDGDLIKLMLPFLYLENRTYPYFTMRKFFLNLVKGIVQSCINFFFVVYMLDESVDKNGQMGGLWFCSVNLYTNILIIVSVELLLNTKYHTWINFVIIIVITFIAYILFIIIVHNMSMFNSYGTMYVAFNSGKLWLNLLFVGGTCGLIDFFIISFEYIFSPSLITKLQVLVNQKKDMKISNINNMPKLVQEVFEIYNDYNNDEELDFVETKKFQDNNVDVKINNKENEQKNIEQNNEVELMKMKNNKLTEDKKLPKKVEESLNTNENDAKNFYNETKTKNANKAEVVVVKGQNSREEIMEEDNNSKEAFLK